jgi:hypothetical protein
MLRYEKQLFPGVIQPQFRRLYVDEDRSACLRLEIGITAAVHEARRSKFPEERRSADAMIASILATPVRLGGDLLPEATCRLYSLSENMPRCWRCYVPQGYARRNR